jgi:hypothetical protein
MHDNITLSCLNVQVDLFASFRREAQGVPEHFGRGRVGRWT